MSKKKQRMEFAGGGLILFGGGPFSAHKNEFGWRFWYDGQMIWPIFDVEEEVVQASLDRINDDFNNGGILWRAFVNTADVGK